MRASYGASATMSVLVAPNTATGVLARRSSSRCTLAVMRLGLAPLRLPLAGRHLERGIEQVRESLREA